MSTDSTAEDEQLVEQAMQTAGQTRLLRIGHGVRHDVSAAVAQLFGTRPVMVVADANTFDAAGRDVIDGFRRTGHACLEPFVFEHRQLHAEFDHVETLRQRFAEREDVIPLAVGSGTINDLTKLASHYLKRPYLAIATAASMDGYSSFGASITRSGFKHTIDCPAPVGIVADLSVIEAAPDGMNASGYADLLAKSAAGADWLLADALAVEPIDKTPWMMIHKRLKSWVATPDGVRRGDPRAVHQLMLGLAMSGFAMQCTQTSRPASGADHQFSHLWDMQHLTHEGKAASHGFQVGIGTLASSALYQQLLPQALDDLDIERAIDHWPELAAVTADVRNRFVSPALVEKAVLETQSKYIDREQLQQQLQTLRTVWPELRRQLQEHLIPFEQLQQYLAAAGCPASPCAIGIPHVQFRQSYRDAYYIRRRFTVLDLAARTGLWDVLLDQVFGAEGPWPAERGNG